MRVTNEQATKDAVLDANTVTFAQGMFFPVTIQSYARDLLEARGLIKEMREELESARTVMEKYEAQLTGELFNDPSLSAILEKSREYVQPDNILFQFP